MIRNKHGLIRMLEAIIAILILLGFFIFTMSKQAEKPNIAEDIRKLERKILEEVSDNPTLRESVLLEDNDTIKYFIASRLYPAHSALNFSIAICDPPGEECILSPKPLADIYVDDIVIGSLLTAGQPPKVLRLFIWIEAEREVEVPEVKCGNNKCEFGENCLNCPADCPCGLGEECIEGVCTPLECTPGWKCHGILYGYQNESCDWSQETCSVDCGAECQAGQTTACWTYTGPITDCEANAQQDGPVGVCVFKSDNPKSICEKGTKACNALICEWSSCGGEVWPENEGLGYGNCFDGFDNDCDGDTDSADLGCQ